MESLIGRELAVYRLSAESADDFRTIENLESVLFRQHLQCRSESLSIHVRRTFDRRPALGGECKAHDGKTDHSRGG